MSSLILNKGERTQSRVTSNNVKRILSSILENVDTSCQMYNLGVNTEFVNDLVQFIKNPVDSMLERHANLTKELEVLMKMIAIEYLKQKKDIIKNIFDASQGNQINYYVVLKEDTFDNRNKIFDFMSQYEDYGFQEKFPLYIKFLPEKVVKKANLKNEIILN